MSMRSSSARTDMGFLAEIAPPGDFPSPQERHGHDPSMIGASVDEPANDALGVLFRDPEKLREREILPTYILEKPSITKKTVYPCRAARSAASRGGRVRMYSLCCSTWLLRVHVSSPIQSHLPLTGCIRLSRSGVPPPPPPSTQYHHWYSRQRRWILTRISTVHATISKDEVHPTIPCAVVGRVPSPVPSTHLAGSLAKDRALFTSSRGGSGSTHGRGFLWCSRYTRGGSCQHRERQGGKACVWTYLDAFCQENLAPGDRSSGESRPASHLDVDLRRPCSPHSSTRVYPLA